MTDKYQLTAWTDKSGRVRMTPSLIASFTEESLNEIDTLKSRIRFDTHYEIPDILEVSRGYEMLGNFLSEAGYHREALRQTAQAAICCCTLGYNWTESEWGDNLCPRLRVRFFDMVDRCKNLFREHAELQFTWDNSGLDRYIDLVTYAQNARYKEWEYWLD